MEAGKLGHGPELNAHAGENRTLFLLTLSL